MLNSLRIKTNCEQETKFVQDRILSVERHIAELCHTFGQYSRKAARLRDKTDAISKATKIYSESEEIDKSLCIGLENFSDTISVLGSFGDLRVQNIDSKVVGEFSKYEEICKHAKEDVKQIFAARDKEVERKRQLDRIKERNPRNRQQIVKAETELVKATAEVAKNIQSLEEKTNNFEKQKLHDIKSILLDFLCIEIGFHAKALEILTQAYKNIDQIDEESDLKDFEKIRGNMETEFKKSLRIPETLRHNARNFFRPSNSLGSIVSILTKKSPGIPKESKSEETLDSMKHSISDSEDDSEDRSEITQTEDKSSPIVFRKKN